MSKTPSGVTHPLFAPVGRSESGDLVDARVLELREHREVVRLEVLHRRVLVAVIVAGSTLLVVAVRESACSFALRHAAIHSSSLHRRLSALVHATPACTCEMYACGIALGALFARTRSSPGLKYGLHVCSVPSSRTSTSAPPSDRCTRPASSGIGAMPAGHPPRPGGSRMSLPAFGRTSSCGSQTLPLISQRNDLFVFSTCAASRLAHGLQRLHVLGRVDRAPLRQLADVHAGSDDRASLRTGTRGARRGGSDTPPRPRRRDAGA